MARSVKTVTPTTGTSCGCIERTSWSGLGRRARTVGAHWASPASRRPYLSYASAEPTSTPGPRREGARAARDARHTLEPPRYTAAAAPVVGDASDHRYGRCPQLGGDWVTATDWCA